MPSKLAVLRHYLLYRRRGRFSTREDVLRYQERAIRRQLDYVTAHTPFYRHLRGRPLADYPMMDKPLLLANFRELNTAGVGLDEAMDFALKAERTREFRPEFRGITVGLSSGTSHSRGVFLLSEEEKARWAGYVLANCLPGGLLERRTIAFFMRANSNLYESVSSSRIRFFFYDIYRDMEEHIRSLREHPPDILVGQPSVLLMLAEAVRAGKLSLRPGRVISIAEVLEAEDAALIQAAFGVPATHQVYQCTEGCLATTCDHGTLHLNEDIVRVDREPLDGRRFIPIVTDFTRRLQPILRYRLNDILVERAEPCPCGLPFTALEKIEGREDDIFVFPGRERTTVTVFPDFIRRCVLFAGDVTDYRVVQDGDGALHVYANADEGVCRRIREELIRLSEDRGFLLPPVSFGPYQFDPSRKLKRVERLSSQERNG